VSLGQWVQKNDTAALIMDAYGKQQRKMRVPVDGLVIGHSTNPLVQQGDAVMHIAYT
jgi:predicted deacylase